jgi:hypothetical protein
VRQKLLDELKKMLVLAGRLKKLGASKSELLRNNLVLNKSAQQKLSGKQKFKGSKKMLV